MPFNPAVPYYGMPSQSPYVPSAPPGWAPPVQPKVAVASSPQTKLKLPPPPVLAGEPPTKARGVSADASPPLPPSPPPRLLLPSPEQLGIVLAEK